MRIIKVLVAVISMTVPAWGAESSMVLYLDGALIKQAIVNMNKVAEIPLPAPLKDGSLRVRPLDDCQIVRVDVTDARADRQAERQIATLESQRNTLSDRLKALDLRESIFVAAAKSHSGKTLRKSKQNPEPLASVRQATEYAISQLEGVYRARRLAEAELKSIDSKIDALIKAREKIARVVMSRKGCRLEISYLRTDLNWSPFYDIRLDDGHNADIRMHANLPRIDKGTGLSVVPDFLSAGEEGAFWPINSGSDLVASYTYPVEQELLKPKPVPTIDFRMKIQSKERFLPGTAACFYRGEFMGVSSLKGAAPGESIDIHCGN